MGGWQQDELELALELGVSPRRLSGWEPRTVTTYEYDTVSFSSGARWRWLRAVHEWVWAVANPPRLLGSVTEREPEWARDDVEGLLALLERGRVGSHGQPMSEATSPLADPSNRDRGWDYEVDVFTDFAQQKLSREQEAFKQAYGDDADMASLRWVVRKVERAPSC